MHHAQKDFFDVVINNGGYTLIELTIVHPYVFEDFIREIFLRLGKCSSFNNLYKLNLGTKENKFNINDYEIGCYTLMTEQMYYAMRFCTLLHALKMCVYYNTYQIFHMENDNINYVYGFFYDEDEHCVYINVKHANENN